MTIRDVIDHIDKCKKYIPEQAEWDKFLDQPIAIFPKPGFHPYDYEMVGLCGSFLPFGVELIIQPKAKT